MNRFINHIPEYKRNTESKIDKILNDIAREIDSEASMIVPVKKGILQSSIRHEKIGNLHYKVSAGEQPVLAYARFQEFGGGGGKTVRHYTTPGTGKEYLKRGANKSIDKIVNRLRLAL